jgi:hypothetical protein
MRVHLAAGLLAAVAAAGGCYASAGYSTGYVAPAPVYTTSSTATVSVDTYQPDLVDVGGGVQVIADYEEPVFYTDNYYWRFYGGTWYRSGVHNGGWVVYNDIPYSVRRIDRPTAYVRYRPSGYVPRAQRRDPYVRDHRTHDRGGYQPAPGPTVRDHRTHDRGGYQPAPGPTVRDHRSYDGSGINPGGGPPPVRDNRGYDGSGINPGGGPVVRDHRSQPAPAPAPAPVVRDHRSQDSYRPAPAPAPAPTVRDHRTQEPRQERREERREPVRRDHRR